MYKEKFLSNDKLKIKNASMTFIPNFSRKSKPPEPEAEEKEVEEAVSEEPTKEAEITEHLETEEKR